MNESWYGGSANNVTITIPNLELSLELILNPYRQYEPRNLIRKQKQEQMVEVDPDKILLISHPRDWECQ